MGDDFTNDDPLFDEMDPCCQREYLDRKKAQSVRARLARTDRSTEKIKAKKNVFSSIPTCGTCSCTEDYSLLKQMRAQYAGVLVGEVKGVQYNKEDEGEGSEDLEDDDDDFGLGDDAYISPYEQAMREQFEAAQEELRRRKALGYCIHAEDSAAHVSHCIDGHENVVVHIYRPDETLCALLDIALENLAQKHTSTRFRRVAIASAGPLLEAYALAHEPQLACFVGGDLIASFVNFEELIPDGDIRSQDLIRHLNSTGVLDGDAFRRIFDMKERAGGLTSAGGGNDSDDENDGYNEEMRFCEVKGCCKQYAHSHVSGGGDGGIFSSKQCGDALDKDYFLKL